MILTSLESWYCGEEAWLVLPLPDSPNRWKTSHPMAAARQKNAYREQCWLAAIQCATPAAECDLPELVTVRPVLFVKRRRDADNLTASLKWVLDALKCRQTGSVHWRRGLYDEKGYMIDDDPAHLQLETPEQRIDRQYPRLELWIGRTCWH